MAGAVDDDEDGVEDLPFDEARRIYTRRHQDVDKPTKVKVVDRLARDLTALRVLFNHATPPRRLVRGKAIKEAQYGFGDASGKGFGASWEVRNGEFWRGREGGLKFLFITAFRISRSADLGYFTTSYPLKVFTGFTRYVFVNHDVLS